MSKLFLLRHAEAGSALNLEDKQRPLSSHGIEQAKTIAPYIKDIDLCLCSSAKRTQMTLETLVEAGGQIGKTIILNELYNAPAGNLLDALQAYEMQNILIIAHNPGIHQLAETLAGTGEPAQLEKIKIFYQPATLSIFDCDVQSWRDIQPKSNTLCDLIIPA